LEWIHRLAGIQGAQKALAAFHGQSPAGDGHELVVKDRPGGSGDQELQFPGPGQTEIPTYLQPQASALVAQIAGDSLSVHETSYNLSK
jgi:hypothetical protein